MNRWLALGLLLAAGLGFGLRVARLGERPMHNDEAVNALKAGRLWQYGEYRYDPHEFHGPSLPYATYALQKLTRAPDFDHFTEARLRFVAVLFGVGLLLVLPLIADALGRAAVLWAALFTALSPAMVFYSRYYIHEILLVFFTGLALGSGWRYWRTRKVGWALLAGAALGLMQATKETFVISLGAAVLSLALCLCWNRWLNAAEPSAPPLRLNLRHLAAAAGVWVAVVVLLFSSFFTNANGPVDSIRSYLPWLSRAGGDSPHIQPWGFYLHRLLYFHQSSGPAWSEAFIFGLAIVGAMTGFACPRIPGIHAGFVRFLAGYTFILLAAYSLIAYKTPWCLLSFWQGMILLAGVGAVAIHQVARRRMVKLAVLALLLSGAGLLAAEAWLAAVPYAADRRNPYVYAHTSPDLLKLIDKVEALAEVSPQGRNLQFKVIAAGGDYWPLPWYLRQFKNVGLWSELPGNPYAPVMIVSASLGAALDEKKTHVMAGYFQLRPQVFLELYVELDLWRAFLAAHPPERQKDD